MSPVEMEAAKKFFRRQHLRPPTNARLRHQARCAEYCRDRGPAAATGPPLGSLAKRPAALKRADGDLFSVLDRYLDNSISTSEQEFTIEDFMEDDALSSYDSQAVERSRRCLRSSHASRPGSSSSTSYPPYQRLQHRACARGHEQCPEESATKHKRVRRDGDTAHSDGAGGTKTREADMIRM